MRRELSLAYTLLAVLASLYLLVVPAAQAQNIDVNVPAKFDQSVTFTGNNTHSGTETLAGLTNITNLNGVQKCDQFAGATVDVVVNACIAAAIATSSGALGIADATGMRNGTIAAQINVGQHTGYNPVVLLLPATAVWSVTITNGTDCGIMLYNKSAMLRYAMGVEATSMWIASASSSTNVQGLVCTDPSPPGSGSYVRAEGFGVDNHSNPGTMACAALCLQYLYDNSIFRDVGVVAGNGTGMSVMNACCSTAFHNVTVNCFFTSGCIPLNLGGTSYGLQDVNFFGGSYDHPGAGQHNIVIGGGALTFGVNFYGLYMEPNSTDTSTALMEIGANVRNVNIFGGVAAGTTGSGSAAYMVDVATWAGPTNDTFTGLCSATTHKLVNDNVSGLTIAGDATDGCNASYVSGTPVFGGAVYGTLFSGNKGAAQTAGNITLPAGWGTGASVALAGPSSQYTQYNEFTITSGSGSFAAAPTVQAVFPTAFPAAPVCSLTVSAITGTGGAILFKQTAQSTTHTTFTATTSTGAAFTPAASETYTAVMQCGL